MRRLPSDFNESYVDLAHQLADAAATVTRKYFRSPFDVETKADASPVTIAGESSSVFASVSVDISSCSPADKESETAMREILRRAVPHHACFGEEHGLDFGSGDGQYMWVLDPIDGTKSFITGKPLFGTLISLLHDGVPILGIIDQPILKERWLGVAGRSSTLNGKEIKTRACKEMKLAYLYATTPHMFSGKTEASFNKVRDQVKIPMYGCDCYAYGLLSAGLCDLVIEADLKPYDYMALVPIIKGAGGEVTDWRGNELVWKPSRSAASKDMGELIGGWPGEVCAAGDPLLHKKAIELLAF